MEGRKILIGFSVLVAIWLLVKATGAVPDFILPTPAAVILGIIADWDIYLREGLFTLTNSLLGLIGGVIAGVIFAILMHRFIWVDRIVYPLTAIIQTIPLIFIYPLFILWLGFGREAILLVTVITCFFPVCFASIQALKSTPDNLEELFRGFNAGYMSKLLYLYLPWAKTGFFGGLKISASYSMIAAVISEWMGSDRGLGKVMINSYKSFQVERVFGAVLLVILFSCLILYGVISLERSILNTSRKNSGRKVSSQEI